MNYNIIAIVYIITLIVITLIYTDPFSVTDQCLFHNEKDCNFNPNCKFNNNVCENKFNENAKYLVIIFGLLIFYLFYNKVNLSYLLLDSKFRKMILIIPFFYIFILIIIYIYLDKKGITDLILYDFMIMILYYFTVDNLNQNLINIIIALLVITGFLLIVKQSMLNIFQLNRDNCTNKLRDIYIGDKPISTDSCPEINKDTCYSLEELQTLYKKVSDTKDCSFCVDYVDNEFKCQTNSYCNKNMKKKYQEDCKNSDGDIQNIIKQNINEFNPKNSETENDDYILECNELNSQLTNVVKIPDKISDDTKISELVKYMNTSLNDEITIKTNKNYKPVFSYEKKPLLSSNDDELASLGIKNGSTIDLTFEHN